MAETTDPIKPGVVDTHHLSKLYGFVENGKFALPEFQRPKVWDDQQEKELIISLCYKVPIGSFLLWEYDEGHDNHKLTIPKNFAGFPKIKKENVEYLVLDGQQRLGFLARILKSVKTDEKEYVITFEEDGNRVFPVVKKYNPKSRIDPERQALVNELADTGNTAVISALSDPFHKMATDFRSEINSLKVPVVALAKDRDRSESLFIYQRVNSSGKRLKAEDYAEATLTHRWPQLTQKIGKAVSDLAKKSNIKELDTKLSRKVFIRCMLDEIFGTPNVPAARSKGLDIFNLRIVEGLYCKKQKKMVEKASKTTEEKSKKLTKTAIENAFKKVKASFEHLEEMMSKEWHLQKADYLLENELIIGSAYIRHVKPKVNSQFNKKDQGMLSKLLILSMLKKPTTGGATQAICHDACNAMRSKKPFDEVVPKLKGKKPFIFDLLKEDLGSLTDAEDSVIKEKSILFALMRMHAIRNDCHDIIDATTLHSKSCQLDHFYPKATMKKYFDYNWDHAANKVWLKDWTNDSKNDKWPVNALPNPPAGKDTNSAKNNLNRLAIPNITNTDEAKLLFDGTNLSKVNVRKRYEDFLKWRIKRLTTQLSSTLNDAYNNGF